MADKPKREVPTFDERTELELDHLSAVTPEDIQRAAQQWTQDAPAQYRGLLGSVPQPTPKGKPPQQP
jgi:predicted Zn-dependent peptidase